MSLRILKIFLIIIFLFLGAFGLASAQVKDSDISMTISPEMPGPMQDVTISVSIFSADLNKAQISWTLDSKPVLIGIGKKTFSFRVGDSGEVSTIDVFINIAGAPSISKRLIVQPGEVDMLWQATDSFVPPFYAGKALPAPEGEIRVVAMPNVKTPSGIKLKSSDFSYSWKRNFDYDQDSSGYGKNFFTFKNSYLDGVEDVSVTISSVLGNYNAGGAVSITPSLPKIVFYEKDLSASYSQAITDGFVMQKNSMKISAIPYFFSSDPIGSDLKYQWSINNSGVSTPSTPNNLTITLGKGSGNQASIALSIDSLSRLFQTASFSALLNIEQ